MDKQTVIFLGPQGSGKGTQVTNLVSYLKEHDPDRQVVQLETGKVFRALKDSDSFLATRVTETLETGQLVPDWLTCSVVVSELKHHLGPDDHLTFDGFPRNVSQAKFLDEVLRFYERTPLSVIYLNAPETTVRERMKGRGRSDDTEQSINERLALYRAQTEPLIDFYKARTSTNFIEIDSSQTITEVFKEITSGLGV